MPQRLGGSAHPHALRESEIFAFSAGGFLADTLVDLSIGSIKSGLLRSPWRCLSSGYIEGDRSSDERLERARIELLPFMDVNRAPYGKEPQERETLRDSNRNGTRGVIGRVDDAELALANPVAPYDSSRRCHEVRR